MAAALRVRHGRLNKAKTESSFPSSDCLWYATHKRHKVVCSSTAELCAPYLMQEPSKELLEDMQRQQTEIEMLSTELDESQCQLRAARASETHLQGTLRAKTALLSFHDDVIAQCAPCSTLLQPMRLMIATSA